MPFDPPGLPGVFRWAVDHHGHAHEHAEEGEPAPPEGPRAIVVPIIGLPSVFWTDQLSRMDLAVKETWGRGG